MRRVAGCHRREFLRPCLHTVLLAAALILPRAVSGQPVPGQNINMVSGTQWPGGDPFLQRQNEPSIAVSSKNPLHLLAGANDYRTVDLPAPDIIPGSLAGDAWLGLFKSFDGGQSWQSTLLTGYPQDNSLEGLASPLKNFRAGADPTVRAGTHGLFYYSGIVFNRGTNQGAVFVARFLDTNRKENGDATQNRDTIRYISTVAVDTGTSGQFLDKPWIAVDIPRAGAGTCTFSLSPTETVPAGNVYLVWSRFTGSTSTKIMFSRSLDCGKTWSNPIKLSESNSINQGTNVAVDPATGAVYVVWRRFASASEPDAILFAKSTNFGRTFPSKDTVEIARILPFDQPTSPTSFRTNTLPSLAVSIDSSNVSRVHVAWAQRNATTSDAQIVVSTSPDGLSWGSPVPVDTAPITDDFTGSFGRGHQFMPQLTFAAGRLMLVYYDQRLDHTLGFHIPNNPFAPDSQGRFYLLRRDKKGDLLTNPSSVFTLFLDDALLTQRRHTVDLRVAKALPGATPNFYSTSVSQYRFGLRALDDFGNPIPQPTGLDQLQTNPPNLPLFSQGTMPFLGDYIDIAGQAFKANANGTWSFNTSPASPPVFYAAWTDNRDVKPPKDGNWTHYTPAGGGGQSVLDPTQTTPPCQNGQEGMRNQNIYSSRITEGLLVASPQDAKPLSVTLQRAFVVTMQNLTSQPRTFRAMIANQPAGGQASFQQTSLLTELDVRIEARSGAARTVFATSSNNAASITVNVAEVSGPGSLGLSGSIVLNPEGSVSPLAQPDGTTADIGTLEIYTPSFAVWNAANPNPFLNISNPNQVLNISNLNISNLNISNPDPAILNISNLNISNTTAANLNISNLNISNLNISNTPITDTTYAVTNKGNTSHSYRVALYGNNPNNTPLQLIVMKNSSTPTSVNCALQNQPQNVVVASVSSAVIAPTLAAAASPNIPDSSASNVTVAVGPGETVFVTLRGALTPDQMAQLTRQLTPVVTAHGANTNGVTPDFAALLFIQTTGGTTLPAAVVGTSYSTTLQATGGKAPITWTLFSGTLPSGLTLSPGGVISGTPTSSGAFTFTVRVADSSAPVQQTATQSFSLTVNARQTATSVGFATNPAVVGQATPVTATVTDTQGSGAVSSPAGTVTLSGDPGLSAGSCVLAQTATVGVSTCSVTLTPASPGARTISASYPGSSVHQPGTGGNTLTVNPAATTAIVSSSANPSVFGQAVTITATVAVTAPGAGTPTGTVTFLDGAATLGSSTLAGGIASFTTSALAIGSHAITASYGGDSNLAGSASGALTQVVKAPPYTFVGFRTPLTTAGTFSSPTFSGTLNLGSAVPIKWQLFDSSGNNVTDLTSTTSLKAIRNTACSGAPTGAVTLLYLPTSGAAGGSTFRSSSSGFIFNWDTSSVVPAGPGCYTLVLELDDDSARRATTIQLQ